MPICYASIDIMKEIAGICWDMPGEIGKLDKEIRFIKVKENFAGFWGFFANGLRNFGRR